MTEESSTDMLEMTAEIVAAYVSNNSVSVGDIAALVKMVHGSLDGLGKPVEDAPIEPSKATAAQIRKSITDAGLVSFEDGKAYKTLKRHLSTRGMTLAEYKAKWGLPNDYPSTSPAYSAARSAMAKSIGLGRKPAEKAKKEPKKPVGRSRKPTLEV